MLWNEQKSREIPAVCISPKDYADREEFHESTSDRTCRSISADLVVLAGYLVAIPTDDRGSLSESYHQYSSVIDSFFLWNGILWTSVFMREFLQRGVKVTGATVHFVDDGHRYRTDHSSESCRSTSGRYSGECLQQRVMEEAEWKILPAAIDLIANGKVSVQDGKVIIAEE